MPGPLTANFPAVYMLVRKDNKLLFVLRSNTGFMDGFYCLPGGRVEPGEPYRAAAIREAKEEVDVTVRPEHAKQVYLQLRYKDPKDIWVDTFFEAEQWSGTPMNALPDEHGEMVWFNIDKLPAAKILDYQLSGIQDWLNGGTYGEFNWPKESKTDD
jgi:8-oxo-dGTP pyrophosphatase MutT (NUDIX family)